LENGIHSRLLTFKNSFDRTIRFVSNPTQNAEPFSSTLCFYPKKNALDTTGYDDMRADLFFH
jgi:hypothetical protein